MPDALFFILPRSQQALPFASVETDALRCSGAHRSWVRIGTQPHGTLKLWDTVLGYCHGLLHWAGLLWKDGCLTLDKVRGGPQRLLVGICFAVVELFYLFQELAQGSHQHFSYPH